MKNFFKNIQKLIKTKFVFYKPTKKKIVIFDSASKNYTTFLPFVTSEDVHILDTRQETINFYVILKIFFSKDKFNHKNYLKKTITLVNPKLVVTMVDNNIFFYELKKCFKDIIFISIQNGIRFVTGDILEILQKNKINEKYLVDYYLIYNSLYGLEIEKYIKGNYITIGSIKNNSCAISKDYNKKSLAYISRYAEVFLSYTKNKDIKKIKNNFEQWEIELLEFCLKLLKNLSEYCLLKKINLNIIGAAPISGGTTGVDSEMEHEFYKNLLGEKNFIFLKKEDTYSSYKRIDEFEVIVNAMSSLGYEAISRKKKVAFFSTDHIEGASFGWPLINEKKGKFFSNSPEMKEVERIINYLFNASHDQWYESINSYEKKLFYFDSNNSILKNLLKKLKI